MLTAITRAVSPAIVNCELTFVARQPIDLAKAQQQHGAYEQLLRNAGARVISLPAEPALPDSMFVEDPAIVLDELAVILPLGTESRRAEGITLALTLLRSGAISNDWKNQEPECHQPLRLHPGGKWSDGLLRRLSRLGARLSFPDSGPVRQLRAPERTLAESRQRSSV